MYQALTCEHRRLLLKPVLVDPHGFVGRRPVKEPQIDVGIFRGQIVEILLAKLAGKRRHGGIERDERGAAGGTFEHKPELRLDGAGARRLQPFARRLAVVERGQKLQIRGDCFGYVRSG